MAKSSVTLLPWEFAQCGAYRFRDPTEHLSHGPVQLFEELKQWSDGFTSPSQSKISAGPGGAIAGTFYLLSVAELGGEYLVSGWVESHNEDGVTVYLDLQSSSSSPTINESKAKQGSVPGFPVYFWVLPAESKLIAVRVGNAEHGVGSFEHYLLQFLRSYASGRRTKPHPTREGEEVIGYVVDGAFVHATRKIRVVPARDASKLEWLMQNAPRLRAVVARVNLLRDSPTRSGLFGSICDFLGLKSDTLSDPKGKNRKLVVSLRLPIRVTSAEVKSLADEITEDSDRYEKVGFAVQGEPSIVWLFGNAVRKPIDLNMRIGTGGYLSAETLLAALDARREEFLK